VHFNWRFIESFSLCVVLYVTETGMEDCPHVSKIGMSCCRIVHVPGGKFAHQRMMFAHEWDSWLSLCYWQNCHISLDRKDLVKWWSLIKLHYYAGLKIKELLVQCSIWYIVSMYCLLRIILNESFAHAPSRDAQACSDLPRPIPSHC